MTMPTPVDLYCQSCAYWVWTKDETQTDNKVLHFGKCIVHAPSPAAPPYTRAVWPRTEGLDGCGEHKDIVLAKAPPAQAEQQPGQPAAAPKEKEPAHAGAKRA
jgi:hypothetical protein